MVLELYAMRDTKKQKKYVPEERDVAAVGVRRAGRQFIKIHTLVIEVRIRMQIKKVVALVLVLQVLILI